MSWGGGGVVPQLEPAVEGVGVGTVDEDLGGEREVGSGVAMARAHMAETLEDLTLRGDLLQPKLGAREADDGEPQVRVLVLQLVEVPILNK